MDVQRVRVLRYGLPQSVSDSGLFYNHISGRLVPALCSFCLYARCDCCPSRRHGNGLCYHSDYVWFSGKKNVVCGEKYCDRPTAQKANLYLLYLIRSEILIYNLNLSNCCLAKEFRLFSDELLCP